MDSDQLQAPSSESREAGYETSAVSIPGLAIFLVCLVIVAGAVHMGAWYLFRGMVTRDEHTDRSSSALTNQQFVDGFNRKYGSDGQVAASALPPPPRLQPTSGQEPQNVPAADLEQMYEREDALFRRMGWTVDKKSHAQLAIPPSVMSTVICEQSAKLGENSSSAAVAQPGKTP